MTARLVLHPMDADEAERVLSGAPDEGARWAPGYPAEGDRSAARRFLNTCATAAVGMSFVAEDERVKYYKIAWDERARLPRRPDRAGEARCSAEAVPPLRRVETRTDAPR